MAQNWRDDLPRWSTGWQEVREDAPEQIVRAWDGALPGDVEPGVELVVVCDPTDVDAVRTALVAAGGTAAPSEVLLTGDVQDLDRGIGFPGDAGLFDAPMGGYSRFEVDEWGHPVAHSTLSVQEDVAFVGPVVPGAGGGRNAAEVLDPLVSAMANEAFLADAQRLYTVAPPAEVAEREAQGWRPAAAVLRLS